MLCGYAHPVLSHMSELFVDLAGVNFRVVIVLVVVFYFFLTAVPSGCTASFPCRFRFLGDKIAASFALL